jgi:hydroxylaminobenzene mutase
MIRLPRSRCEVMTMDTTIDDSNRAALARQGQRLLQLGVALFLFSSIVGFAIPHLGSQRVGLSVHTLSALQGVMLIAEGLVWTRLRLGRAASRVAFWCDVHGTLAILAAYTFAAITGTGLETIRLAGELPHGLIRGTVLQETVVKVLAYSSAPTGIASFALILWGLRTAPEVAARNAER